MHIINTIDDLTYNFGTASPWAVTTTATTARAAADRVVYWNGEPINTPDVNYNFHDYKNVIRWHDAFTSGGNTWRNVSPKKPKVHIDPDELVSFLNERKNDD